VKAFAKRQEERNLPRKVKTGHDPPVGQEHEHARNSGAKGARRGVGDRHIAGSEDRQSGKQQHNGGRIECGAWAERRQRPAGGKRADDAYDCRERFPSAKLMAAMIRVAQRGEVGMVASPVQGIRRNRAEREQLPSNAAHLREQRILQPGHHRACDDKRFQPEAPGRHKDEGTDHKPAGENEHQYRERGGRRDAGAKQIHSKERAAAAQRQRVNAVMQVEQIDVSFRKNATTVLDAL